MKKIRLYAVHLAIAVLTSLAPAQVTGNGTTGKLPVWTGTTALGNSVIVQRGGNIGIGLSTPTAKLQVVTPSSTGVGIAGVTTAPSGNTEGVFGSSASPTGLGVYGIATAPNAHGVFGLVTSASGVGGGVLGQTESVDGGAGVVGLQDAASGFAQGFFGATNSPNGTVALLRSRAGGDIVTGQFGSDTAPANVFRVDRTGKGFFDGGTQTGGADFAESIAVAKTISQYEPGDLLIVDTNGKRQLKLSGTAYSTLVAGIYSTKPGVLATVHRLDQTVANEIPLAIVGIVPCKVSAENGPIQPGDLLVTSSTPGHAMKGTDRDKMLGAVVGKALEPLLEGNGVVQVLVTLQ